MNVDPDTFLRHFNFSIRNTAQRVNGKRRYSCPLHQDSDLSLSVHTGPSTLFRCIHPSCGFMGDAVSMLSVYRGIPVREALDLFRPGGEFSDCVSDPMRTEDFDAYLENADIQIELKTYLAKCRRALKQAPEKAKIRPGMSVTTAKMLHPCAGLFLDYEVPKVLSEFTKPKYRGAPLILYPYTKDGNVTKIDVVDPNNPAFRSTVVVTHPSVGVFGEEMLSGGVRTVIASDRPETVAAMYATWMQSKTSTPPFVAFQGYPLPESFCDVTHIAVVSTLDSVVSDEFPVHMLSASEIIRGKNPAVKFASVPKRTNDVSVHDMDAIIDSRFQGTRPLHETVAFKFIDMVKRGQEQEVVGLLVREQMPIIARSLVKSFIESDTVNVPGTGKIIERLSDILSSDMCSLSNDIVLANGRTVHRAPTEIVGYGRKGREVLCNVGLSVESKIVSYDGGVIYVCSVSHSDDFPTINVRIPEEAASRPSSLQSIVSKAFSERGYNPYVAFYSVPGFSWTDVLSKLSEHCTVCREVSELGLDSASEIQLPDVTIKSSGEAVQQNKVFTMPENVLRVYAGIPVESESDASPYKDLLTRCDNLYVAAFALGVFHVTYQMLYGMFKPDIVRSHMMRHFFYVDTEPGIWGRVFKQVADLFSGNDFTPTVNYSDPMKTLQEYSKLGCLPLIAYVPTMGGKLSAALDATKTDLLGLLDTSTAVMMNGKVSAVYVTPSEDTPMDRGIIGGRDIDSLRRSFVPFVSRLVREAKIDTAFRASSVPCVAVYDECCRIFDVGRSDLVDKIAKNYFPGTGMNGFTIFCDLLHRWLSEDSMHKLGVVNGPPQRGYSFTRRGQHVFVMQECVVISHMVVDMLNQAAKGKYRFDVGQLTDEMAETGELIDEPDLGIDGSRCWYISRKTWETKIVRPPINLAAEVENGTIGLKPIR